MFTGNERKREGESVRKFFVGIGVAVLGVITIASAASAVSTGGIGGRPANPDEANPRTQSIFVYDIDRGVIRDDAIIISNATDETQTIELLAVDGEVTNTGAYACKQNVETPNDLGSWITLSTKELTLEPGAKQTVPFTVRVPKNADVGEHNACIVYQRKDDQGEAQDGVRIRTRQALRVVATIPGDLKRDIAITSFALRSAGSGQVFDVSAKNEGNVSADVTMGVRVSTLFGREIAKAEGGYPVLANQTLSQSFTTEARPMFGGWYKAVSYVEYGSEIKTIGLTSDAAPIHKDSDTITIFLWPTLIGWAIIAGVLIIIVACISAACIVLHRKRAVARRWVSYVVREGDTIGTIAQSRAISWKLLAKANSIRAPYSLKPGQTIKVPRQAK